jgi:transcriptional regulator NrdR family protein
MDETVRYVFVMRPTCPACGGVSLQTIRSQRETDGSISRWTHCRRCQHKFFIVWEIPEFGLPEDAEQ